MGDILAFKLSGVYRHKAQPTPDGFFSMSDADWEALCRKLAAVGVVPNREWSYETLTHMLNYADRVTYHKPAN